MEVSILPDTDRLLYRRQFIIGPSPVPKFTGWKQTWIDDDSFITSHPDLRVTKGDSGKFSVAVLGYILDPHNTSLSDLEIVAKILNEISSIDDLPDALAVMGGRYVIVAKVNNTLRVFNDCAGFRQVFFMKADGEPVWCASQPALLSEALSTEEDKSVMSDLSNLSLFRNTTDYWFPGNRTVMKNVFHLRPNHYLDLRTGKTDRYWPKNELPQIPVELCVEKASSILQGICESATRRFNVAFAITGGLDTRVVLAACRNVTDKIHFFTHTHAHLDTEGADIAIPREMLSRLGLEHHVVTNDGVMGDDFESIFRRNVTAARKRIGLNAYAILNHFAVLNMEPVVITGSCGEITRLFYKLPDWYPLSGRVLAALTEMSGSRVAEEEFDNWLRSARKIPPSGIDMLDLFYLENRNANWCAMSYSEYDIAFESLSPLNCRSLIETMLGTDKRYRKPPHYYLHKELIRKMWPELLEFPINPPTGIKEHVLHQLRRTKSYEILRFLKFLYRLHLGK